MSNYVIKRVDKPTLMLSGVGIGSCVNAMSLQTTNWTISKSAALHFNQEEAEATIEFITNVIDWELGEQLFVTLED